MNQIVSLKKNKIELSLISIIFLGFLLRFSIIPFGIPITTDAVDYFVYANHLVYTKSIPYDYLEVNYGWSLVLSNIFKFFENTNMIFLMDIQRITSVIISSLVTIPIFYLIRSYYSRVTALIASSIISFEPHLVLNSILGITEPLFIGLICLSFYFCFNNIKRNYYFAFIFLAIASIVRYEGIMIFFAILTHFLLIGDRNKQFKQFIFGISIFFIITITISLIFSEYNEVLIFFKHIVQGGDFLESTLIKNIPDNDDTVFNQYEQNNFLIFFKNSIEYFVKYIIWISIPLFLVPISFGLLKNLKKISRKKLSLIIFSLFFSIAPLYVFGRGIEDPRYLFVFFIIFTLISSYSIEFFKKKIKNKILYFIPIIFGISLIYVHVDYQDLDYEFELYQSAKYLAENANGVNQFDGGKYLRPSILETQWPKINIDERKAGSKLLNVIDYKKYNDFDEYIKKEIPSGLTHIIVTKNSEDFFDDLLDVPDKFHARQVYSSDNKQIIIYKLKL